MTDKRFPFVTHTKTSEVILVDAINKNEFPGWLSAQSPSHQEWVRAHHFNGSPDQFLRLPTAEGRLGKIAGGFNPQSPFAFGAMLYNNANSDGIFEITTSYGEEADFYIALGWAAAAYRFTRYKSDESGKNAKLVMPKSFNSKLLKAHVEALYLVRDLINTPANDLGPSELAEASRLIATSIGATYNEVVGEALLEQNFPAIHAVGRASEQAPRLVEIIWGNPDHPRLALIGKGVTYDTGGLSLKSNDNMFLMKKDMGGAAHALAMLHLIVAHQLPVHVHLLIPAVENSIGSRSYRPSDIIRSRNGMTIEIGNTDAEGRVAMSDCFVYACEHKPDFVVDFATLTGQARTVIGYETAIVMSNDTTMPQTVIAANDATYDMVWPLPLKREYTAHLGSHFADIRNDPTYRGGGGAIHAALFLERFLGDKPPPWIHVDCSGWTQTPSPGHPVGGEACGLRAIFKILQDRFAK